jgi:5-oxoprolinase (ATP-hydrolysing)
VRTLLGLDARDVIPSKLVGEIKLGTTVATNALLEREGDRVVLLIARGFREALRIAYQARADIFANEIILPEQLYERVIEVDERVRVDGAVEAPLDLAAVEKSLATARLDGFESVAAVFMHAWKYPDHERKVAELSRKLGLAQVSASHEVSPLLKLVGRGDTTEVDAYLSPILARSVTQVAGELGSDGSAATPRPMFMMSSGGLTLAERFRGNDAILSGPAGGVVGMVETARIVGFKQVIGFDMGGTSTDVAHYDGEYERAFDIEVAGVRIRAPMMRIHTVAAGGGSILHYEAGRLKVGPDSAGADPGPACYRRGGPLTVTDANVLLGKLQPSLLPQIFGTRPDEPLDAHVVRAKFETLACEIGKPAHDVAEGFLTVAVENMASAIKKISVQRGYDVTRYLLNCFGGAGGQHACLVADALGMETVLIHPFSGLLSAHGIGLSSVFSSRQQAPLEPLAEASREAIQSEIAKLRRLVLAELTEQGVDGARAQSRPKLHVRHDGTDSALPVDFSSGSIQAATTAFEAAHNAQFGFVYDERQLVVETVEVEGVEVRSTHGDEPDLAAREQVTTTDDVRPIYFEGAWRDAGVYGRETLSPGCHLGGPASVIEPHQTIVVEPDWRASVTSKDHLLLRRTAKKARRAAIGTEADPILLEVFNNLSIHVHRGTNGRYAPKHSLFRQHQGAPRLLLRSV